MSEVKRQLSSMEIMQERDRNRKWFTAHHEELKAKYGICAFVVIEDQKVTVVVTDSAQINPTRAKLEREGRESAAFYRYIADSVNSLVLQIDRTKTKSAVSVTMEVAGDDEDNTLREE